MIPADDAAFAALTRKISREAGLTLDAYKDKCLRRRIAVRMRACGVHTFSDYQTVLDRSPAEYERLKDAITINVTRFYRNADTWNLLRAGLLQEVCERDGGEVRAWSAGCSSGEEPYTLAVLMADHFDRQGRPERFGRVTVDATDIDRQCLERAQAGRYRREALTDVPADLARRYFEDDGADCRVIERVRRRVVVRALDLNSEPPPRRNYQLILCRNVVIYFGRATQERVFLAFAEALAPGGILVLGKVETLFGPARERLTLLDPRERIYRRTA
ncbi:MAG: protein-glutamate O-methyltransferase CheR [Chloroflexota bacterium]|nr:protein-glutamate O-methyltransferase CheR [Chloroflexota bacterium]